MPQEKAIPKGFDLSSSGDAATPYATLASVQPILDKFSPPAAPFDRNGAWRHTYAIWLEDESDPNGFLEIERKVSSAGISLKIESVVTQTTGAEQSTKAEILCAPDLLCTPKSWRVESMIVDAAGKPVQASRLAYSATAKGGVIEFQFGNRKRQRKAPLPFTSNWSLFDAVQRMPGKDMQPLRFTLLEDLDLVKLNQRLLSCEPSAVKAAGGKQLTLRCFEQTGDGILPFRYWLNEQGRLLLALSGTRAYVWDPEARKHRGTGPRSKGRGEG
jgi:hypothetical protein